MQVRHNSLSQTLRSGLPGLILLHGEEALLVEESRDLIRAASREQGYLERLRFMVDPGFDWSALSVEAQSQSLFAEQRMIELRIPSGRPGEVGAKFIHHLAADTQSPDCWVLICGRLDPAVKKSKWVKKIDEAGWVIEHWPIDRKQLPQWLAQRIRQRGLSLDAEALAFLAYSVEGNLLAAAQEIDRLSLLFKPGQQIDLAGLQSVIADHARFNVFALADACLLGDLTRALRIFTVLRQEGTEPVLINWALLREVRTLIRIHQGLADGQNKATLYKQTQIWAKRASMVDAALTRLDLSRCQHVLRQLARADRVIKGQAWGKIEASIESVILNLCRPDLDLVMAN